MYTYETCKAHVRECVNSLSLFILATTLKQAHLKKNAHLALVREIQRVQVLVLKVSCSTRVLGNSHCTTVLGVNTKHTYRDVALIRLTTVNLAPLICHQAY